MPKFAVQYLATVRGELSDREVIVRAASADDAKSLVQSKHPAAHVHSAEQVSA